MKAALAGIALIVVLMGLTADGGGAAAERRVGPRSEVRGPLRIYTIAYRAHTGARVKAFVAVPVQYGPANNPELPLVISPHGRGLSARANLRLFGVQPARGPFVVVSPEGTGRKLGRYSWGSPGQIDDLARMPEILHRTLPWLRIDRDRIYALGGSMGGQEALLLLARYHRMLAGVAAFDAVTDFARQYRRFVDIPCGRLCRRTWNGSIGRSLQSLARQEVGGTPQKRRAAFAVRSPITYSRTIAGSCVPLQLWWSRNDRIVSQQVSHQSGALYRAIRAINPRAPVEAYIGAWRHSAEMRASARLPGALASFGLIESSPRALFGVDFRSAPEPSCASSTDAAAASDLDDLFSQG